MSGAALIGALRVMLGLDSAAFTDGLSDAQVKMQRFDKKMKGLGGGIAKAGAAISVAGAGIAVAIRGQLNMADDMSKAASKFGVPIEQLTKMNYAADLSGVSTEQLGTALGKLSRGMSDAMKGGKGAAMFKSLGVEVADASGKLRSSEAVMQDLSDVFAKMPDGAEKTALAMQVFGKSGADMIPMLNMGADEMRRMGLEAEAMGLVVDEKTGKAAENFNDNLSRLQGTLTGLATQIMASLAPALEWISAKAVELAQGFQNLSPFTQSVIAGFAAFTVVAGPVLLGLGAVVAALGPVVGAFKLLAAVVVAHPILAVIAALALGAWYVYENWAWFKEKFAAIWQGVKDTASVAWEGIKWAATNPIDAIKLAWDVLPQWFTALGQGVYDAHKWAFDQVVAVGTNAYASTVNAWALLKIRFSAILAALPQAFRDGWAKVKAVTAGWFDEFLAIGGNIVEGFKQGIKQKWDDMVKWFEGLAQSFIDSTMSIFDEHSPSRVFMMIGRFITEGLGIGIERGAGSATAAMDKAASDVLGAGQNGLGKGGLFGGLLDGLLGVGGASDDVFGRMGRWMVDMAKGATSLSETLKKMVSGWASSLAQSGMQGLTGALTGSLGKVGGGLLGGVLGGLLGFADGGSFAVGGTGGIDSQLVAFRASPNEQVSITKPGQGITAQEPQRVQVDVRTFMDESGAWQSRVENIAYGQAVGVMGAASARTRQAQRRNEG